MSEAAGVIRVELGETAQRVEAFEFELPTQAARTVREASDAPVAQRADGSPLPDWLVFDAERLTFSAVAVPPGGLPMEVAITGGGYRLKIEISGR